MEFDEVYSLITESILNFYKGKKVLITGHTGFKGSWLCLLLTMAGADVIGYALEPDIKPALFDIAGVEQGIHSVIGDVRDLDTLQKIFLENQPEVVFHLAAQPIVRVGYMEPVETYSTNVMGTINVLECVRKCDSVKSVVNVTTDKVYRNESGYQTISSNTDVIERCEEKGLIESDVLDGFDPYSNSKSCSELVTATYIRSFLNEKGIAVSTMRAGNVIGGGDFEKDRIIPDCVRAAVEGKDIIVRNPYSVRPYQHVLEPLFAYLMVGAAQYENRQLAGAYNIGPDRSDCVTTGELATMFCDAWGENLKWKHVGDNGPKEAGVLRLDCSKLKNIFHWQPVWNVQTAVAKVVQWSKIYRNGGNIRVCMEEQARDYMNKSKS